MLRFPMHLKFEEEGGGEPNPGEGGGDAPLLTKNAPEDTPIIEEKVSDLPEWKQSLPEDLRESPTLKPFNDIEALAKSYINTKKMVGGDKIPVPGEHASADDWREVFGKLGLPETKDDYKIELPKEVEQAVNPENFEMIREKAYELNILPHQLKGLVEAFHEVDQQAMEKFSSEMDTQRQEALGSLKKEWGVAFEANAQRANRLIREIADDKDWEFFEKTDLTNSPQMTRLLGKLADKVYGEAEIKDGGEIRGGRLTPSEALLKIDELKSDKAYMDGNHPNHKNAVAEMNKLYKMAYPS